MQKITPLFPGFHLKTLRRKRRTEQQKIAEELALLQAKTISQLGDVFGKFIPQKLLQAPESGAFSRHRIYSAENTFWAFMSQVLSADGGCQEVVRKIQAFASVKGADLPSSSTAAYCKARSKLDVQNLEEIFKHTVGELEDLSSRPGLWSRRVIVIDGTGFSMPDTPGNAEAWPKQSQHKEGCGFPQAKLVGCFSLHTGGLLSYRCGNKSEHELTLFRKQWDVFEKGDIALGDKGFCNYHDIASLQKREVDSVMSLRRKPFKSHEIIRRINKNDCVVRWKRPQRIKTFIEEEWSRLPTSVVVRQVRIQINIPGFRTQEIYLVTTLTDPDLHSTEALGELYFQRWDVELFFRDIKITMQMDILRCKTPAMIKKELTLYLIAYNCIRQLMVGAAEEAETPVRRVSFKAAVQALRNWEPHLNQTRISRKERLRIISELYACIAQKKVPERPGRSEPRAVKRRRKNHRLLTRPRAQMVVPNIVIEIGKTNANRP